jgi:hypothetical protein
MNERIKELALQAGVYSGGMEWTIEESKTFICTHKAIERFAELIVRECALVAKTLPHTPERHWVTDSVTYIPVHCEQNILKHFGVKN